MVRDRKCSPQTLRVLSALLGSGTVWRYGYELSRVTALKSGSLYPVLRRLAQRDLLEVRWEAPPQPGRPARHACRLSAAGVAFATGCTVSAAPAAGTPRP